jgi:hypothetical protein
VDSEQPDEVEKVQLLQQVAEPRLRNRVVCAEPQFAIAIVLWQTVHRLPSLPLTLRSGSLRHSTPDERGEEGAERASPPEPAAPKSDVENASAKRHFEATAAIDHLVYEATVSAANLVEKSCQHYH